jgi:antitoxin (DNA-binding transcriptional repressor) of toxin-antitoxin stability system
MLTISKSKLKAHMLRVFREIEDSGQGMVVTDRGKPVLKIEPIAPKLRVDDVFGHLKGKVKWHGDPNQPTTSEWGNV